MIVQDQQHVFGSGFWLKLTDAESCFTLFSSLFLLMWICMSVLSLIIVDHPPFTQDIWLWFVDNHHNWSQSDSRTLLYLLPIISFFHPINHLTILRNDSRLIFDQIYSPLLSMKLPVTRQIHDNSWNFGGWIEVKHRNCITFFHFGKSSGLKKRSEWSDPFL